jgi:hypothetical protein
MDGDTSIVPSDSVRNLGTVFDKHMAMQGFVNSICAKCNFHLRRISSIRDHLTTAACKSVVVSLVLSSLDYCNALLAGLPVSQLARLQRIQNWAARLVTKTHKYDHITPVLRELHWLPVSERITFKLLVYVYKALNGLAPQYITTLLQRRERHPRLRQLHDHLQLATPVPTKRESESVICFRKELKTHLFRARFS